MGDLYVCALFEIEKCPIFFYKKRNSRKPPTPDSPHTQSVDISGCNIDLILPDIEVKITRSIIDRVDRPLNPSSKPNRISKPHNPAIVYSRDMGLPVFYCPQHRGPLWESRNTVFCPLQHELDVYKRSPRLR